MASLRVQNLHTISLASHILPPSIPSSFERSNADSSLSQAFLPSLARARSPSPLIAPAFAQSLRTAPRIPVPFDCLSALISSAGKKERKLAHRPLPLHVARNDSTDLVETKEARLARKFDAIGPEEGKRWMAWNWLAEPDIFLFSTQRRP